MTLLVSCEGVWSVGGRWVWDVGCGREVGVGVWGVGGRWVVRECGVWEGGRCGREVGCESVGCGRKVHAGM